MKKILAFLLALILLLTGSASISAVADGSVQADPEKFLWDESEDDAEEDGSEGTISFVDPAELALLEGPLEDPERMDGFFPEIVEKHIIGKDSRKTIKSANKYPYSAIALLEITFPCKCRNMVGTAFMIGKKKVLTAAHCLICQKHNKWAKRIVLNFGYRKGKGSVYRYTGGWEAHCGTGFPGGYQGHDANDWAVIKLDKNVGDRTGWFGYWCLSDSQINNYKFYITGYRSNKMKRDKGSAKVLDSKRMWVNIDVLPGNSGSPVYRTYKGGYYAVGIWTTYWENGKNSAVRLTNAIMKYVKKY